MDDALSSQFVRLLLQHEQPLLRYALPFVGGNLEDARDVLQDAAVTLLQKFPEYRTEQPFLPWARQFVRYSALTLHRKRRRYTFLSEELISLLAQDPPDEAVLVERRRQALEACLGSLPSPDRDLIESRYRETGPTVLQLAETTNQSANVLYKTLARIRRQLLACIESRLAACGV